MHCICIVVMLFACSSVLVGLFSVRGGMFDFFFPSDGQKAQCPVRKYQAGRIKRQSGGYSPGVPPLPIPNREVKPRRADGTAPQCGRVGRRLFQYSSLSGVFPERLFFLLWVS